MSLMRRRETTPTWNPFREMEDMMDRMSRVFGRTPGGDGEQLSMADWSPSVNIREDDEAYVVEAELPSLKKEDVKVAVEEGMLTIEGERKLQKEEGEKGSKYHRVETAYGSFARRFALPEDADDEKVDARFENGMLEVTIPKSGQKKPRAREISVR
ncbi:MAG: Hsp20/alpha crystallin family protein [Myxococcota bacterium]